MMRKLTWIIMISIIAIPFRLAAYTWDGKSWADYTYFMSPITWEVKENCHKIMAVGKEKGRVAGRLGFVGDSITYSMAYMATSLGAGAQYNETGHDYQPIRSWLCEGNPGYNSWYRQHDWLKGPKHGNYSGWRISNALGAGHPKKTVRNGNYSWCLIMYGTNDIDSGWDAEKWKKSYKKLVQGFIDLGVIPVISTIPPERTHVKDQRCEKANDKVIELAKEMKIPYVDYYGVIKHHKPGNSWDGTLIANDGTHPTGSGTDFSKNGITNINGNATRSKLTYDMAEKIKEIIFEDGPPETSKVTITSDTLPGGYIKSAYGPFRLNAVWGQSPYKWSVTGLPGGVTVDSATGTISGTPTENGIFRVQVKVTGNKQTDNKILELAIKTGTPPVTITLSSVQDTYLSGGDNREKNFGSKKIMICQGNNTDKYRMLGLLKFDLSKLPLDVKINSAILKIFCKREQNTKGGTLRVFGVKQMWTENGATFKKSDDATEWPGGDINKGALDEKATFTAENHDKLDGSGNPNPEYKPGPNPYGHDWNRTWVKCDIKLLIDKWLNKSVTNNGLAICTTGYVRNTTGKIKDPNYGYMSFIFNTRESKYPPKLVIEYQIKARKEPLG